MVTASTPPKNGFVRQARKIYNPLGFAKGYNAILWLIFDGALLGFILSRLPYLSFDGILCGTATANNGNLHAAPGECYYFLNYDRYKIGIRLHLATILPAGLLAVLQFVPAIRHRVILYHRIAGYFAVILVIFSNVGALMIADRAFGGSYATQGAVGTLAVATTIALGLALYNIKKLQIDQHRAWMLRVWFWMGSIITTRIIQIIAANIIAVWPYEQLRTAKPCDELVNLFNGNTTATYALYPTCDPSNNFGIGDSTRNYAVVTADFQSNDVAEISAGLDSLFGMAIWMALALHAFGVETYLRLTSAESDRLRQVSYERQLARGWKNAGYAGLVPERLGDCNGWTPADTKQDGLVTNLRQTSNDTLTGEQSRDSSKDRKPVGDQMPIV